MPINLVPRARCLRKQLMAAEKKLWGELRRHQFEGLRFHKQVPIGAYIITIWNTCFKFPLPFLPPAGEGTI